MLIVIALSCTFTVETAFEFICKVSMFPAAIVAVVILFAAIFAVSTAPAAI